MQRKSNLRLVNVNIQSVRSKKSTFMNMTESANPDILVGTDTWLKPSIYSSEFMPTGYEPPFRKDRPDGYGEVLVAVKTGLIAEEIPINTDCEMVCVEIQTAVHHPLIVIGAYRPTNNNSEYAANLCTSIKSVAQHNFLTAPSGLLVTSTCLTSTGRPTPSKAISTSKAITTALST